MGSSLSYMSKTERHAIFTAARALLATQRLDSSKHSGVIALFNLFSLTSRRHVCTLFAQ